MNIRKTYTSIGEEAHANILMVRSTSYLGRWIFVGLSTAGDFLVQAYGLTGRSTGSRNRILLETSSGFVETKVADPSKETGDPKLTLYPAMATVGRFHIVSNGRQSLELLNNRRQGLIISLQQDLEGFTMEPDSNCTARISAVSSMKSPPEPLVEFSIIKRHPYFKQSDHSCFRPFVPPGYGYFISTYAEDTPPGGDRIPPFHDEPLLLPIPGRDDMESLLEETLWGFYEMMKGDNYISSVVKVVDLRTGDKSVKIHNRYHLVPQTPQPDLVPAGVGGS
jgi:hypothetical protein